MLDDFEVPEHKAPPTNLPETITAAEIREANEKYWNTPALRVEQEAGE